MGVDGKKLEPESNVLLASIENMQYAVTLDVLHTVLSTVLVSQFGYFKVILHIKNLIWYEKRYEKQET